MLSEYEEMHIESRAKNYTGNRYEKAMAERLLEINKELKTALQDKENAENMAAEAAKEMIGLQNELQEKSMQLGDLTEEKDALLDELAELKRKAVFVDERGPYIREAGAQDALEAFYRMREAAEKHTDKGFDEGNTEKMVDASMLITILSAGKNTMVK
ncbi:hypothetical protein [Eubacterium sp.]|uniref:hypothetical protein n=1 Tax=Eubacterium sp. TaxID=142586 RepID=UPI0026E0D3DD|nr:hypothetical protein [Eubacterium sp.]MDO5433349.1 hypothetical protein [Eubacterium sp.]